MIFQSFVKCSERRTLSGDDSTHVQRTTLPRPHTVQTIAHGAHVPGMFWLSKLEAAPEKPSSCHQVDHFGFKGHHIYTEGGVVGATHGPTLSLECVGRGEPDDVHERVLSFLAWWAGFGHCPEHEPSDLLMISRYLYMYMHTYMYFSLNIPIFVFLNCLIEL